VAFSADRSTWVVKNLVIFYTAETGEEQEYKFDEIVVDTGSSLSELALSVRIDQIRIYKRNIDARFG
jgi:hypothetical protein